MSAKPSAAQRASWRALAAVVCAPLALAACSQKKVAVTNPTTPASRPSATAGSSLTGGINPCSLLTKAEAEDVLGVSVVVRGNTTGCNYSTTKQGSLAILAIVVTAFPSAKAARQAFEAGRTAIGGSEKVGGLGDDSFYLTSVNQLWTLKGRMFLNVSVIGPEDMKTAARAASAKALARF